jgi:hypothetical protein
MKSQSAFRAKFVEDVCQPDKAIEIDVLKVNEDPLDGLGSVRHTFNLNIRRSFGSSFCLSCAGAPASCI